MVYIVILNWNGWEDTLSCLDSIYHLDHTGFKVVVCDNGSHDGSVHYINEWYARFKLTHDRPSDKYDIHQTQIQDPIETLENDLIIVKSDSNLGYAGGNNLAIRFCLTQNDMSYVWLLNNDTEVSSSALSALLNASEKNSNKSILGSKLAYFSNRDILQGVGGSYNYWLGSSRHILGGCPVSSEIKKLKIDYPIGASLFFPRSCIEAVGLLSEDYFLYYEELDYINRAKKIGYSVDVAFDSLVYHKEGASIKKSVLSDFYFIRNKFIISYKYKPLSLFSIFLLLPFWALNRFRRREFRKSLNCFKAFGSFVKWVVNK